MRRKKYLYLCIVIALVLTSCSSSKKENQKKLSEIETTKQEKATVSNKKNELNKENNEKIIFANNFHDGYAWIETEDEYWNCIDEKGNVLFKLKCVSHTDIINNYAVIDNSYVIDLSGEILYNFKEDGYTLFDYECLDVGCIMLSKEIDTFEKSGTYFYTYNIEKSEIREADLTQYTYYVDRTIEYESINYGNENKPELNEYLCNGLYTIAIKYIKNNMIENKANTYITNEFYDCINNEIVSVKTDLDLNELINTSDPSIYGFCGGSTIGMVSFDEMQVMGYKNKISENGLFGQRYPEKYFEECSFYTFNYEDENYDYHYWCYDFINNDDFEFFDTNNDKNYEILYYKDGIFCLSVKNDVGTLYVTIIDKNGKELCEPVKYDEESFAPRLIGDSLIYYYENSINFIDISSGKLIHSYELQIDLTALKKNSHSLNYEGGDEKIVFYDEDEGYVICQSKDDKLWCFDGKGQVILEGIEAYFISEQRMYSNGYLMINYIDEEGSWWKYYNVIDGKDLEIDITNNSKEVADEKENKVRLVQDDKNYRFKKCKVTFVGTPYLFGFDDDDSYSHGWCPTAISQLMYEISGNEMDGILYFKGTSIKGSGELTEGEPLSYKIIKDGLSNNWDYQLTFGRANNEEWTSEGSQFRLNNLQSGEYEVYVDVENQFTVVIQNETIIDMGVDVITSDGEDYINMDEASMNQKGYSSGVEALDSKYSEFKEKCLEFSKRKIN